MYIQPAYQFFSLFSRISSQCVLLCIMQVIVSYQYKGEIYFQFQNGPRDSRSTISLGSRVLVQLSLIIDIKQQKSLKLAIDFQCYSICIFIDILPISILQNTRTSFPYIDSYPRTNSQITREDKIKCRIGNREVGSFLPIFLGTRFLYQNNIYFSPKSYFQQGLLYFLSFPYIMLYKGDFSSSFRSQGDFFFFLYKTF